MKTTEEYFQEFYSEVRYQIEQGAKANFTHANKIWAKYEASQSAQADEIATLRAQLAEAREALQPFAELLEAMNQHGWKKESDETESAFGIDETWLTIGDFRKAAKQVITA